MIIVVIIIMIITILSVIIWILITYNNYYNSIYNNYDNLKKWWLKYNKNENNSLVDVFFLNWPAQFFIYDMSYLLSCNQKIYEIKYKQNEYENWAKLFTSTSMLLDIYWLNNYPNIRTIATFSNFDTQNK